jgi:hypothetical protein
VALEAAGMFRRIFVAQRNPLAERSFERFLRDPSRAQQHRRAAREVDDRRFDSDLARPAFEHEIDIRAEIGAHVRGRRRRHAAEAVR